MNPTKNKRQSTSVPPPPTKSSSYQTPGVQFQVFIYRKTAFTAGYYISFWTEFIFFHVKLEALVNNSTQEAHSFKCSTIYCVCVCYRSELSRYFKEETQKG